MRSQEIPWLDDEPETVGVTGEQVAAWEQLHKLKLPKRLLHALELRNGGILRDREVRILPLEEIRPLKESLFASEDFASLGAADRTRLLVVAVQESIGGLFLLDFNRRGLGRGPKVLIFYNDGTSPEVIARSIGDFFNGILVPTAKPAVDWSEAETSDDVIFRETIDLSSFHDGEAALSQALVRKSDHLLFFTHLRSPGVEELTRIALPLPLVRRNKFDLFGDVYPRGHATRPYVCLNLEVRDHEGIRYLRSERQRDDGWDNVETRGVPTNITLESTDPARLEEVRLLAFTQLSS